MSIKNEIQKLSTTAVIELFVLDATSLGGRVTRFHAGTNVLLQPVVWQGETYEPFPMTIEGFDASTKGELPRPTVEVSNIGGGISQEIARYNDLVGAIVTRKRTMARYLDAVNSPGNVNPDADRNEQFPDDIFIINRKISENKQIVKFELVSPFDVAGVQLPLRQVIQNTCTWVYRSAECSYAGTPVAEYNDELTSDPAQDECGKRLSSCKLRFGEHGELPFGAFPAVGRLS